MCCMGEAGTEQAKHINFHVPSALHFRVVKSTSLNKLRKVLAALRLVCRRRNLEQNRNRLPTGDGSRQSCRKHKQVQEMIHKRCRVTADLSPKNTKFLACVCSVSLEWTRQHNYIAPPTKLKAIQTTPNLKPSLNNTGNTRRIP